MDPPLASPHLNLAGDDILTSLGELRTRDTSPFARVDRVVEFHPLFLRHW